MYLIIPWIGVAMAQLYSEKKTIGFKNLQIPLLFICINTAILGLNVLYMGSGISLGISPFLEFRHFSFAMLAIFLFIIWNNFQLIGFNKLFHFFIPIASISYGIYISHWFLVVKASYLNGVIVNSNLRVGIYIVVCLLFAYFIEHVVYVRINKWMSSRKNLNI